MSIQVIHDHRNTLGSVRDQGSRPTCVAHAVSTAHEHTRGGAPFLSPEYIHYFSSRGNLGQGVQFPAAMRALLEDGQPTEVDCPYGSSAGVSGWKPPAGLTVFRRQSELKSTSFNDVVASLEASRIPVLGLSLPDAFFRLQAPWILSIPGAVRALHAVVAVGSGENKGGRFVLIRNSWGKGWGDSGHAWLHENFLAAHLVNLMILTEEIAA